MKVDHQKHRILSFPFMKMTSSQRKQLLAVITATKLCYLRPSTAAYCLFMSQRGSASQRQQKDSGAPAARFMLLKGLTVTLCSVCV